MTLKHTIKTLLCKQSIALCNFFPTIPSIYIMRTINGIQLNSKELMEIVRSIRNNKSCKLLIFGVGNDSLFWSLINSNGTTFFIEDNKDWLQITENKINNLTAYLVTYNTTLAQADELLDSPELLHLELPGIIESTKWDVIIVDAPAGYINTHPGRMKSIATAARLARNSGDIFVHDCHRKTEIMYCDKYLKSENFISEIHHLRHYRAQQ